MIQRQIFTEWGRSMKDYIVMRCGTYNVTIVTFNNRGIFVDASTYPIHHQGGDDVKWLNAFSSTLDQIPKILRNKVSLVTPPNSNVFTKYITLPDVEKSKFNEALQFEFCRNFPGEITDWVWEAYKFKKEDAGTFILAMQSGFAERLLDILLRKDVKFSYLCPEILLMQTAIKNHSKGDGNIVLTHIGSGTTLFSISNGDSQYMRIVPFATEWIDEQIANSQKVPIEDARNIRQQQLQKINNDSNGASFVKYYVRQFGQKFQQELKRSELFFYRTINQSKTSKILMSGILSTVHDFSEVIQELNPEVTIEPATQSVPSSTFHELLSEDKRATILQNVFTFIGAAHALINNDYRVLNLFSESFKHQISFQRRHPSYMAAMIIVIFATILGLKLTKQKIVFLISKKSATEAKLREAIIDVQKYNETISTEKRIRESIKQIKSMLYSQDDWLEFFNHLQESIKSLKYAWIDSFSWHDLSQDKNSDTAHMTVKIFVEQGTNQPDYSDDIQNFIKNLKNSRLIDEINNINIAEVQNSILTFSFDIKLNTNLEIFLK